MGPIFMMQSLLFWLNLRLRRTEAAIRLHSAVEVAHSMNGHCPSETFCRTQHQALLELAKAAWLCPIAYRFENTTLVRKRICGIIHAYWYVHMNYIRVTAS